MSVSRQELQAVENQLVEAGISRDVARARVQEIERGASGRKVFNLLFQDQIGKVAKDAMSELFRVRSPMRRAQTFDQLVKKLLDYKGRRPTRSRARENLKGLGLPQDFIKWAVDERIPFTPAKIADQVVQLRRNGKSQEKAWREGLKLAAQDHIIEGALRADVTQLGIAWTAAAVIALISLLCSVVFAVIELVIYGVGQARSRKQEAAFKKERQNYPLTEVERRELVILMEGKATWEAARQVALDYIRNFREGRKGFRSDEEESLEAMWREARTAEREAEREARLERILYSGGTARIRSASAQAALMHAGWESSGANVDIMEQRLARMRRSRWLQQALELGLPLAVGGSLLAGIVLVSGARK